MTPIQALVAQRKLLAYHDRSDGGLLVTLAEMAFAGHCGINADIASLGDDRLAALFNEELGAVIQVRAADREAVESVLAQHGLADCVHYVGQAVSGDRFVITANGQTVFSESRTTLRVWWAETTWQMQRLRDNPECADQGAPGEIKRRRSGPECETVVRYQRRCGSNRILPLAHVRKLLCCVSRA
ncbi:Phosphoribosylformylglycinamidine synthase [Escherichia coli]|nr:Phosphoribosylformylglycinamidine synthase [Escherichia coli]